MESVHAIGVTFREYNTNVRQAVVYAVHDVKPTPVRGAKRLAYRGNAVWAINAGFSAVVAEMNRGKEGTGFSRWVFARVQGSASSVTWRITT